MLAAREADPAGWAMPDADVATVAASFAAAQENRDDPALARKALALRLALQREMGVEQPRLLSDAERDEIAGQLAQAAPADRAAIIAGLRARYGAQAGMLSAELTGEVDANTALLLAHADMSHLPRLLAQGMTKSARGSPAKPWSDRFRAAAVPVSIAGNKMSMRARPRRTLQRRGFVRGWRVDAAGTESVRRKGKTNATHQT